MFSEGGTDLSRIAEWKNTEGLEENPELKNSY
jgi:hypothetical protein